MSHEFSWHCKTPFIQEMPNFIQDTHGFIQDWPRLCFGISCFYLRTEHHYSLVLLLVLSRALCSCWLVFRNPCVMVCLVSVPP